MRELPILMNGAMVRATAALGKLTAVGRGLQRSIVAEHPNTLDASGTRDVPRRFHVLKAHVVTIALDPPKVAVVLALEDRPRAVPVVSTGIRDARCAEHHHVVTHGVDHG